MESIRPPRMFEGADPGSPFAAEADLGPPGWLHWTNLWTMRSISGGDAWSPGTGELRGTTRSHVMS